MFLNFFTGETHPAEITALYFIATDPIWKFHKSLTDNATNIIVSGMTVALDWF